jgi:hypothetical protein
LLDFNVEPIFDYHRPSGKDVVEHAAWRPEMYDILYEEYAYEYCDRRAKLEQGEWKHEAYRYY